MMAKKLKDQVTLFATIDSDQHQALRELAFMTKRFMADLVREALAMYLKKRKYEPR